MDGDGQHNPTEIERLVGPILDGRADLVIGSRMAGSHEPVSVARSIGIRAFNMLINMLAGTKITDCSSGFRAVDAAFLGRVHLEQEQYHTAEMIIETAKHSGRTAEVPVAMRRRWAGQSKKGGDIVYGLFFLRTILKTWLR